MLRGLGGMLGITALGAIYGEPSLYDRRLRRRYRDDKQVHVLQDELPEGDCTYRPVGSKRSRRRRAAAKRSR